MASKKKVPLWWLPPWMHKARRKRARLQALRARDGDLCWRCNKPMRFEGLPNCGKAATIEHRTARSQGGTWAMDNLVLCHVGCNRHLGDKPRAQKERMRINLPAAGAAN